MLQGTSLFVVILVLFAPLAKAEPVFTGNTRAALDNVMAVESAASQLLPKGSKPLRITEEDHEAASSKFDAIYPVANVPVWSSETEEATGTGNTGQSLNAVGVAAGCATLGHPWVLYVFYL